MIRYIYKILKGAFYIVNNAFCWVITWFKFIANGVHFSNDFIAHGYPIINVNLKGSFTIGKKFSMNNGKFYNMIGRQQRSFFVVGPNAHLSIGDNVGLSATAIVCRESVTIGNHVRIGGNTVIYDTDFHSLEISERTKEIEATDLMPAKPVVIKDYAFIGAHCTILKGVTIGRASIVGAGSVVTKNIPDGEVWAGNPAKFIRVQNE